jgi:Protein of unknown function (DUF1036)
MGLYFHNATGSTIDLAYAEYRSGCASEGSRPFVKRGWYSISPGQTRKVWSGWAGPKRFYYYAESVTRIWGGDYVTAVPPQPFEWCWDTASTQSDNVGFDHLPPKGDLIMDRTVTLR